MGYFPQGGKIKWPSQGHGAAWRLQFYEPWSVTGGKFQRYFFEFWTPVGPPSLSVKVYEPWSS